mgnify:CR=1 FL=1
MCIRDSVFFFIHLITGKFKLIGIYNDNIIATISMRSKISFCLLYTSDAADERSSVDLGGRRIIKKKKKFMSVGLMFINESLMTQKTK